MSPRILLSIFLINASYILPGLAAEWVPVSQGLPEAEIERVVVDNSDANVIYASSFQRLYKSADAGRTWRQIFALQNSDHRVQFIYADPQTSALYVASTQGIWLSMDGGNHWRNFYKGFDPSSKAVFCMAGDPQDAKKIWIGTGAGLYLLSADGQIIKNISAVPRTIVYSIFVPRELRGLYFVATENGIYRSRDAGEHWEKVSQSMGENTEALEGFLSLGEWDVEEIDLTPGISNIIFMKPHDKLYAATKRGISEAPADGGTWSMLDGQNLPDQKINLLAQSAATFYAATDKGVFGWDAASKSFRDLSAGLESPEAKFLFYHEGTDILFVATRRGIFKLAHPELYFQTSSDREFSVMPDPDVLRLFEKEPTVRDIQNAAIQYAEVDPKKIESWRSAAARRALLPTLSVSQKISTNSNIDLDRGGTADPDKFIFGPADKSSDWSLGLSWNLGDIVWNNDQTSIDTRSRLMVELRDDILNEVTHLYYERRRLQVAMAQNASKDFPAKRIEQEIRLQELTASIDALTGGYLSGKLASRNK